jgi:hypothetical protein
LARIGLEQLELLFHGFVGDMGLVAASRDCSGVYHLQQKHSTKVITFGLIARHYKFTLVVAESGTVNAEGGMNDLTDRFGIITDINERGENQRWTFVPNGVAYHTAASSIADLNDMVKVVEDWSSASPGLSPMESMRTILKDREEKVRRRTKEGLINLVIALRNAVDIALVNDLMDSVPKRLQQVIQKNGSRAHC